MTTHNRDFTDTANLDLDAFIRQYGPPHYPTQRNPVGSLNEVFWAGFMADFNEMLFENRENEFYRYGGKIYLPTSQHLLLDQVTNDILHAAQGWRGYEPLSQLCNARHLGGVISHLKGKIQKEGVFNRKRDYVHVANGVIMLNGAKPDLVPFSPLLISRNLVPIAYDPSAKCPRFIKELLKPLPEEDQLLLQKIFGMFLVGINFLQIILILQGAAGSGKSQLAIVARLMLGEINCAELRTSQLGEKFETSRFVAKTLLIGADVPGDFLNHPGAHNLKKLTGGDPVEIERKHSNAACTTAGTFPVLITCNSRLTVRLDGDRGAWERRLRIINYTQKKHEKDVPYFAEKLVAEEGPGILNWMLKGLELVNKDVAALGTVALTDAQKLRTEALLNESDGLRIFVEAHIKANSQADLTTQEIIEHFAVYCADPGRCWRPNPMDIARQLPGVMLQLFGISSSHSILRNGKGLRGYRNVIFAP